MIKEKIIVPGNIRYISDWKEFKLFDFPHIMNKKIPGCGFTEYCIRNLLFTILCSPRIILLENKAEQHPEVFYFRNELDKALDIDKDLIVMQRINNDFTKEDVSKEKRQLIIKNLENSLRNYILGCMSTNRPCKILVTYDSFRLLKDVLVRLGYFDKFYTVVDEFQSIFTDSRFKSDTEIEFINHLKDVRRLCFVSATPMIDKYLEMLDEFKDLPYFELDWETDNPLRVLKPDLDVKVIKSVTSTAVDIIKTYKSGEFEKTIEIDEQGNLTVIESREAVLYVNSVKNIASIIKKSGIMPEEVNILCANTSVNQRRLDKIAGKDKYIIGKVPLRDEPRKMFTLCTRTVYLGADFYSDNARTFILSDANIETLAVDITLDLPQILGRQRLIENPWKNRAELYFKSITKQNLVTEEDFNKYIAQKLYKTERLLAVYDKGTLEEKHYLAETYQFVAKSKNYRDDFVAVNTHGGKDMFPVRNDLVIISERRAFDIQQIDYKDRFSVFYRLEQEGFIGSGVQEFLKLFNSLPTFYDKMKAICESSLNNLELRAILEQIPIIFKNLYNQLGPINLKACGYNITNIKRRIEVDQNNEERFIDVKDLIYSSFNIGERYSLIHIKQKLGELYNKAEYLSSPKATDLEKYFEVKKVQITNKESKKRDYYYEILKKKD